MRHLTPAEFDVWANDPGMLRERGEPVATYDNSGLFEAGGFALEHEMGCMVFVPAGGVGWFRTLDVHFLFPPSCRGPAGLAAAYAMIDQVFVHEMCGRLIGTIKRDHAAARWFIRRLGFAPNGSDSDVAHYQLTRDDWRGSCGLPLGESIACTPLDIATRSDAYLRTTI